MSHLMITLTFGLLERMNNEANERLRLIGSGTYGKVYYDTHKKLVIKRFRSDRPGTFIREVSLSIYLKSWPYFVKIRSFNLDKYHMSMEPWASDLCTVTRQGQGTIDERLKIFTDVVSGLDIMHRLGLIHADVKLSNIMVRESKHGLEGALADFGLSSLTNYADVDCTTAIYSEKVRTNSTAHDIYSLGIVALELFGDVKLFQQPNYPSALKMTKHLPERIHSIRFSLLVSKMLTPNHLTRITTQEILRELGREPVDITSVLDPVRMNLITSPISDTNLYHLLVQYCQNYKVDIIRLTRCIELLSNKYDHQVLISWTILGCSIYCGRFSRQYQINQVYMSQILVKECISCLIHHGVSALPPSESS